MKVLVTVGTTRFDALISHFHHINTVHSILSQLWSHQHGSDHESVDTDWNELMIQYGSSPRPSLPALLDIAISHHRAGVDSGCRWKVHMFEYVSDLSGLMEKCDVVISHAGSGTILEFLNLSRRHCHLRDTTDHDQSKSEKEKKKKRRMVVVVNEELMDNHQKELAYKLDEMGHVKACQSSELVRMLDEAMLCEVEAYPQVNPRALLQVLNNVK